MGYVTNPSLDATMLGRRRERIQRDLVQFGLLAGLATFAPDKFAEHDRLWESQTQAIWCASALLRLVRADLESAESWSIPIQLFQKRN